MVVSCMNAMTRHMEKRKRKIKKLEICLITVFFFFFKNNFLFLKLKNLFDNLKWTENKICSQNSICEGN